jgi:uncharacterized SAM-binding protein YcdF (DUF218 family)
MRRLFRFIFQLVTLAVFIFLCITAWIVFDGLTDSGQKADCALVTGHLEAPSGQAVQPRLDRVVKLYNDGAFPVVIVSVATMPGANNEAGTIVTYLETHGVPPGGVIETRRSESTQETARLVSEIMKSRGFQSVMIVTDYYHVTRVKLALTHEGVGNIEKAHVGKLRKEDALKIGREVVALCDYVGHIYLLPAAEKAKEEAKVGMDKASVDAEKAKEKVDKSLDNMAK